MPPMDSGSVPIKSLSNPWHDEQEWTCESTRPASSRVSTSRRYCSSTAVLGQTSSAIPMPASSGGPSPEAQTPADCYSAGKPDSTLREDLQQRLQVQFRQGQRGA